MPRQSFSNPDDYYAVLGVEKNASTAEVTKASRKLQMQYHPDKNQGVDTSQQIRHINTASEALKNPDYRKAYDEGGVDAVAAERAARAQAQTAEDESEVQAQARGRSPKDAGPAQPQSAQPEPKPEPSASQRAGSQARDAGPGQSQRSRPEPKPDFSSSQRARAQDGPQPEVSSSARSFFAPQSAQRPAGEHSQGQKINNQAILYEALTYLVHLRLALEFVTPRNQQQALNVERLKQQSEVAMFILCNALVALTNESKHNLNVEVAPDFTAASQRVR